MERNFAVTIKANSNLSTDYAVRNYISELTVDHPELMDYRSALVDVVNTNQDEKIEIYNIPAMDGEYVSGGNGTRILWMPEIGRAALNSYQAGDWQWTDASSPEDALEQFQDDNMAT